MKHYIFFLLLFGQMTMLAQEKVKLYTEEKKNGYLVFVDNQEHCPVSIQFDAKLSNLKSTKGNNTLFVIPADTSRFLVTELDVIKPYRGYKSSYTYAVNYGNDSLRTYDKDFPYYLPFQKGKSFKLWQGYNGSFSHQNQKALDFTMPIGTEVCAVRDGVVVEIVEHHRKGCPQEKCKHFDNYIIIYHEDGTFAKYSHLKLNGAKVKAGSKIKQGEVIGYSGNVGWSSGPHLHLVIYHQQLNKRRTLETKFLVGKGEKAVALEEKQTYTRNY